MSDPMPDPQAGGSGLADAVARRDAEVAPTAHPSSAAARRAGAAGTEPLWREEVSVYSADERYVGRRQFAKFLVLTSLGMWAGNLWILAKSALRKPGGPLPELPVARLSEVPVGGARLFNYPTEDDPCLLVRWREDAWAAYSQRCTHLSCPVFWKASEGVLACPCHHGAFAVEDGRVLQGPPPRPLPRVRLQQRGDLLVAIGLDAGGAEGRA